MIIKKITETTTEVIDLLVYFEQSIFDDPWPRMKFERDVPRKFGFSMFVAYKGEQPIAYKAGYERTGRLYYSWLGGVLPSHRGKGIAKTLLHEQHLWLKEQGYKVVQTFTENKYRPMLILNIKEGFDVIGVYKSDHDEKQTIMLEKAL